MNRAGPFVMKEEQVIIQPAQPYFLMIITP